MPTARMPAIANIHIERISPPEGEGEECAINGSPLEPGRYALCGLADSGNGETTRNSAKPAVRIETRPLVRRHEPAAVGEEGGSEWELDAVVYARLVTRLTQASGCGARSGRQPLRLAFLDLPIVLERHLGDSCEHRIGRVFINAWRRRRQRAVERLQCGIDCSCSETLHLALPGDRVGDRRSAEVARPVRLVRERHEVSRFMNKFRDLGFIEYNGDIKINTSLLSVVLHD